MSRLRARVMASGPRKEIQGGGPLSSGDEGASAFLVAR